MRRQDGPSSSRPLRRRFTRVALVSAMTIVGVNVWTGSPLLALWVGSRIFTGVSMAAVFVVLVVLAGLVFVSFRALRWLDVRFGEVIGRMPGTRQPPPWLKSASGERIPAKRPREPLTASERTLAAIVVLAIVCFEVWFFFLAGSSVSAHTGGLHAASVLIAAGLTPPNCQAEIRASRRSGVELSARGRRPRAGYPDGPRRTVARWPRSRRRP
jgi:hypothetical protein